MTAALPHIDFAALFHSIDPQIWGYAAAVLFVVHIAAMIVINRFGWKMRTMVAQANPADAEDIPKDVFAANPMDRANIYGFILLSRRRTGITKGQYAWIRIARFSLLLFFACAAACLIGAR